MRLLVIDDDEQFLSTVTAFLTQRQHHVQGVASGPAGWGLLESRFSDFEAVLLDIRMPELNGLDLLRRLRKADIQLPVVLVTGNADLPKVTEAVYLGISGLVHKPFLPRQLDEVLEKLERQLSASATPPPVAEGLARRGDPRPPNAPSWLQQVVEVMQAATEVWTSQPKESLVSLAERSGLWSVTRDDMTQRPRTLQKYLQLKTLPKRPHLESVLATADFVLEQCPHHSSAAIDLASRLKRLRFTLDSLGKTPKVLKGAR